MKRFLVIALMLLATALMGITIIPSYMMNSDGDMVAGVNLLLEKEALSFMFDATLDIPAVVVDMNAELKLTGVSGTYMFGVGYDSVVATPSIAFLYKTPVIGTDFINLNVAVGTGDFKNVNFGKKLVGDIWNNHTDFSVLGSFNTVFVIDSFKLDTGLKAGYYVQDSSYEVSVNLGTTLFEWIVFDAKAVILPALSWEFLLKAVLVF